MTFLATDPLKRSRVRLELRFGDELVGALMPAGDAYVSAASGEANELIVDYEPSTPAQERENALAVAALTWAEQAPETYVLYRIYAGDNTIVLDGLVRAGRHILLHGLRVPVAFVGRVLKISADLRRRPTRDLIARPRRWWAENRGEFRDVAGRWTQLATEGPARPQAAVLAVHGTMATAVPLCAALEELVPAGVDRYRFEHDTHVPLHHNADELHDLLVDLEAQRLVIVAHSRGGLVVRHALDRLSSEQPQLRERIRAVTLGTPFEGTPMVDTADAGMIALRSLMGLIRVAGGIWVDAPTYLAGMLLRTPDGIAVMSPDSDYLAAFAYRPFDALAVAGEAVVTGERAGLALLETFGKPTLGDLPHDLVVPAASAARASEAMHVRTDHFSYLQQEEVCERVKSLIAEHLDGERVRDGARVLRW